jgi:glutamyl-tRNA reductase
MEMNFGFRAISLSHKQAPLEIRELVALSEENNQRLLQQIREVLGIAEALIVSTCNRTEIYYISDQDLDRSILTLLALEKGISQIESLIPYFQYYQGAAAITYLFRVAIGLEAMVAGDLQISYQVKRSYQMCADLNMAGPFLHRLMHTIFFASKRVAQETEFRDGAASVSYAAAELAEELTANLIEPKVLVLGLGEIGADVARHLAKLPNLNVTLCNRTVAKAEALAAECGHQFIPFELADEAMCQSHVVISSLAMEQPYVTGERLAQPHRIGYQFFIDLSVPRSVAESVEQVSGALVYNIDNIRTRADKAVQRRLDSIPKVERIIEEAVQEFNDWSKNMVVSPTIQKLKGALEQIRQEELARYLKSCKTDTETQLVEKVTRSMMNKILKLPVLQLKAACQRGDAENLIGVLNDLFQLEGQTIEQQ